MDRGENMEALIQQLRGRTLLFADTEFSRLPQLDESMADWALRARLLAVGVIVHDDRLRESLIEQFYAVARLDLPLLRDCSEFTRREVVPRLDAHGAQLVFSSTAELAQALHGLWARLRARDGEAPVVVLDWFGEAALLAPLLPADARMVLIDQLPDVRQRQRGIFNPRPRHNALDDAHSMRDGFLSFRAREFPRLGQGLARSTPAQQAIGC